MLVQRPHLHAHVCYSLCMAELAARPLKTRVPAELVERIDKLRDPLIPREAYIRDLLDRALTALEAEQPKH